MTDSDKKRFSDWISLIPRRGAGLVVFILIVVIAFSLGLMLSGSDDGQLAQSAVHDHDGEVAKQPTIWTCSMHPQIKLPKPGKCPICFMDLIPLESGSGDGLDSNQLKMTEAAKQLARIETTPVVRDYASAEIRMVGRIAYDETKVAVISARIPGRIDQLYADYTGLRVAKGDRLVKLYSPELLSAQEELIQAKKSVEGLRVRGGVLLSTAITTLDAAREKLSLYGLPKYQIDEIEERGTAAENLTIYAPIGGTVIHKNATEGMYVQTGTDIYTIADLKKLWVLFDAYESDLPWLRIGQTVKFASPSFPGEQFDATISFIDPIVDQKTRTISVRAIADNTGDRLKPDMFVSGVVKSSLDEHGKVADQSDRALVIPASAPLLTGSRAIVYVQVSDDDGPVFEGREVVLGPRAGDLYIVKSGLVEGELVVSNGAFKIDSELQIHAKPSMMSPSGGGALPHEHNQSAPMAADMMDAEAVSHIIESPALETLTPVFDAYFEVQMALASDDPVAASESYAKLRGEVSSVDMSLFDGETHMQWMSLSDSIVTYSKRAGETEDIDQLRDAFYHVSKAMIDLEEGFGHSDNRDYFLTFCPMARDNRGAYWLQTVDTVYNSFYGAMMLRCGEIKGALPSNPASDK
ncbi:MAG: efflux RND transporter periplasmic adaptor subunit [Candidatus Zixiibacteriota bacterium]